MTPRRILIANPFGIGDVLFTTPCLRSLREHFPDAFIGYVCNRRTEELMRVHPCLDAVFVFEKDEYRKLWRESVWGFLRAFLKFLREVRSKRFDTLIDFSLNWHYGFFGYLLGIPARIGFNYRNRGKFLTKSLLLSGFEEKHVVEYHLELLTLLGISEPHPARMEVHVSEEDRLWAKDFLESRGVSGETPLIGIAPGGGTTWGASASYKHWPKGHYVTLAGRLLGSLEGAILFLGDSSERAVCEEIARALSGKSVVAAGETTLRRLYALMARCRLVICNDGGILHLAVSANVPTLSFFGPVDPVVYGPFPTDARHRVLTTPLCCRPCYRRFKYPFCERQVCLEWILPEKAFEEAKHLLEGALV